MTRPVLLSVLVAALGYFVDVYDIILFAVVRMASLRDILPPGADVTRAGVFLLNVQLAGMLLGGIVWGTWGDKKGRLSILFGSILLYSAANIANAFVTSMTGYAACRFFAGLGLAGELGAGITLVAEILPKDKRGIGTAVVSAVGVAGGVAAALVGDFFPWKTAYIVGGCMGLALFALRLSVVESGMFTAASRKKDMRRGDLRQLFGSADRMKRLALCILTGVPLWFMVGLVFTFAPELGRALGLSGELSVGKAIFWVYIGLVPGDLASGLFSQWLKSRRKALAAFISGGGIVTLSIFALPPGTPPEAFYACAALAGFFGGYWALFVTVGAESFGTNLRATAASCVPNFVRATPILLTTVFALLKDSAGVVPSLVLLGLAVFAAALLAVWKMRETFGTDLAWVEK